jgi:hypothetical protein
MAESPDIHESGADAARALPLTFFRFLHSSFRPTTFPAWVNDSTVREMI